MKRSLFLFILLTSVGFNAFSQWTIDECVEEARNNYPLIKKYGLIEQAKEYSLSNAKKGYLPQFQVNVKATYQSSVVELPVQLPGLELSSLPKDQYMAMAEANQLIWDGGAIQSQKQIVRANSEVEKKQLEVELYAIEERVNQLFFGILLFDAQLEQNQVMTDELERNRIQVATFIENGIANATDLNAVRVEQLRVKQSRIQLQSTRAAYMEMLAIMMGENSTENRTLIKPEIPIIAGFTHHSLNRPELQLFDAQEDLFDSQKNLIKSSYLPKLGLFLQGGVGRPALNMLSNAFEPFYIGGIRLTWNLGTLYTQKNDLRKIETNKNGVNLQRDLFLYNIRLAESRENKDIQRIRELMKDDEEIISLRSSIRKAAETKVANGMLTVTDLLQEVSREDLARQTKAAHEIDLLIAIYSLKNTLNN